MSSIFYHQLSSLSLLSHLHHAHQSLRLSSSILSQPHEMFPFFGSHAVMPISHVMKSTSSIIVISYHNRSQIVSYPINTFVIKSSMIIIIVSASSLSIVISISQFIIPISYHYDGHMYDMSYNNDNDDGHS